MERKAAEKDIGDFSIGEFEGFQRTEEEKDAQIDRFKRKKDSAAGRIPKTTIEDQQRQLEQQPQQQDEQQKMLYQKQQQLDGQERRLTQQQQQLDAVVAGSGGPDHNKRISFGGRDRAMRYHQKNDKEDNGQKWAEGEEEIDAGEEDVNGDEEGDHEEQPELETTPQLKKTKTAVGDHTATKKPREKGKGKGKGILKKKLEKQTEGQPSQQQANTAPGSSSAQTSQQQGQAATSVQWMSLLGNAAGGNPNSNPVALGMMLASMLGAQQSGSPPGSQQPPPPSQANKHEQLKQQEQQRAQEAKAKAAKDQKKRGRDKSGDSSTQQQKKQAKLDEGTGGKKKTNELTDMQLRLLSGALNMDALQRLRFKTEESVEKKLTELLNVKTMRKIALQYKVMRVDDIDKDTDTAAFAKKVLATLLV